ncbi:MAG: hypothetical protein QOF60_193 [Actinomycetota bacterium]|nr:hypothetical protein [Actinomycetota bacterium]
MDPHELARQFLGGDGERDPLSADQVGSLLPFVVEALLELADRDPNALPRALERLARHNASDQLLQGVLAGGRDQVRQALERVGIRVPRQLPSVADTVIYLVLRTVATHDKFVEHWITYDTALLASVLRSSDGVETDVPTLASMFHAGVRARSNRWGEGTVDAWWDHDWSGCDDCLTAARAAIGSALPSHVLDLSQRIRPDSVLRALSALGGLSVDAARELGWHPKVRDETVSSLHEQVTDDGWTSPSLRVDVVDILPYLPLDFIEAEALHAGQAIAVEIVRRDLPRSHESVAQILGREPGDVVGLMVTAVALVWSHARQLAIYEKAGRWDNREARRGVAAQLVGAIDLRADAWVALAQGLLERWSALGEDGRDAVALAALQHDEVIGELRRLADEAPNGELRDLARGVASLVSGVPPPSEDLRRWLADSAARAFDGVPLFPHPLTALARTWMGATEIEESLTRSIRRALVRFGDEVKDQGGGEEEGLTKALVKELEFAFRDTEHSLKSAGRHRLARAVSLSQRPVPKKEEASWGCDLALLLDVAVHGSLELRTAELIQVKKSKLLVRRQRLRRTAAEGWVIDVEQLRTLLGLSESSAYWLILAGGEVVSLPARVVYGLAQGRGALKQATFTVGYNDVRHSAVPIEQFLPELVMGMWVGSISSACVEFAQGQDNAVVPRHIIEISVRPSAD